MMQRHFLLLADPGSEVRDKEICTFPPNKDPFQSDAVHTAESERILDSVDLLPYCWLAVVKFASSSKRAFTVRPAADALALCPASQQLHTTDRLLI